MNTGLKRVMLTPRERELLRNLLIDTIDQWPIDAPANLLQEEYKWILAKVKRCDE